MATSTGRLTPSWLADRFAEIEEKDMRVVEVRVRSVPRELSDCVKIVRGERHVWGARLVEDRTMRAGVVTFRHERAVDPHPRPRVAIHSRTRTIH